MMMSLNCGYLLARTESDIATQIGVGTDVSTAVNINSDCIDGSYNMYEFGSNHVWCIYIYSGYVLIG